MTLWDDAGNSAGAAQVTMRALADAFEAVQNRPAEPCKHVVSPEALYRPGTYICEHCMAPVEVPYPLSER